MRNDKSKPLDAFEKSTQPMGTYFFCLLSLITHANHSILFSYQSNFFLSLNKKFNRMLKQFLSITSCLLLLFSNQACKTPAKSSEAVANDALPTGVLSFLTTRDGNFEVYTMNADGTNATNLTNHSALDFWSSWSPDGKYLLFYSNRDGSNDIYRMDADGKNQVNLSNHPSNDYLPCWSPDGKQILFTSDRDHKNREIYSMNSDGSNVVRITTNDLFEEVPTWSPDGSKILFTRQLEEVVDTITTTNGEIFIMDKEGTNVKQLTHKKGYDSGAKFSPDGKRIAFYGPTEEKKYDLFLMNADGSNRTNLTNDALEDYSPDWSPDGQWIAYTSGTSKQYDVWIINVKTKKKIRLTDLPKRNETPVWRPE